MKKLWSPLTFGVLLTSLLSGPLGAQTPKAATPAAPATAKPATPPAAAAVTADKVVLKVGNRQFTKADIDFLIAGLPPQMQRSVTGPDGKRSLGDQYALLVALSQHAESHHLDQSPEFIHKLAFQKEQLEAQEAYEALNTQVKVTPEDIQQYFNTHADEFDEISVRQIIVRKKAPAPTADPAHPAAASGPGLAPEQAKTKADAIRKALLAGTDVKKVTDDFKAPGDIIIDAEPRPIRHGGMRPDMEKVAFALKDGEVSEPIDVPQALVLFQVVKHTHSDLKDVSPEIEKKLRQEKVEASVNGVKKNANIWMDDDYFGAASKPQMGPSLGAPTPKPTGKL